LEITKELKRDLAMAKIRNIWTNDAENTFHMPLPLFDKMEKIRLDSLQSRTGLDSNKLNELIDSVHLSDADLKRAKLLKNELFSSDAKERNNEVRRKYGVLEKK